MAVHKENSLITAFLVDFRQISYILDNHKNTNKKLTHPKHQTGDAMTNGIPCFRIGWRS